jgi:hypothetical protein
MRCLLLLVLVENFDFKYNKQMDNESWQQWAVRTGGEPGRGIHSTRIFGLAAFDLLPTVFAAVILAFAIGCQTVKSIVFVVFIFLLIGVIVHEMLSVDTRLNAFLFSREWPSPNK